MTSVNPVVLVVGGTGVFGSRLAAWLLSQGPFDVVVSGRDGAKGEAFCARHGGRFATFDRTDPKMPAVVAEFRPSLVIDASGPFQAYHRDPYALARAALDCGAHYLDLSDDAGFTTGIACLDAEAKDRGLSLLSGASSVPALSSAAADALTNGMADVHLIETLILPGNRAPRGLSVIRGIVAQVGKPLAGPGTDTSPIGWSDIRRETLHVSGFPPQRRLSSPIGAPDLSLFPPGRVGCRARARGP